MAPGVPDQLHLPWSRVGVSSNAGQNADVQLEKAAPERLRVPVEVVKDSSTRRNRPYGFWTVTENCALMVPPGGGVVEMIIRPVCGAEVLFDRI